MNIVCSFVVSKIVEKSLVVLWERAKDKFLYPIMTYYIPDKILIFDENNEYKNENGIDYEIINI